LTQCGSRLELARALYQRAALGIAREARESARSDAARARDLFIETGAARDRVLAEQLSTE
jgi:hypothetical protein